jgi:hypothetical protein
LIAGELPSLLEVSLFHLQVSIDFGTIREVIGDSSLDLFKRESREALGDCFWTIAFQESIDDGIERDTCTGNSVAASMIYYVVFTHKVCLPRLAWDYTTGSFPPIPSPHALFIPLYPPDEY